MTRVLPVLIPFRNNSVIGFPLVGNAVPLSNRQLPPRLLILANLSRPSRSALGRLVVGPKLLVATCIPVGRPLISGRNLLASRLPRQLSSLVPKPRAPSKLLLIPRLSAYGVGAVTASPLVVASG